MSRCRLDAELYSDRARRLKSKTKERRATRNPKQPHHARLSGSSSTMPASQVKKAHLAKCQRCRRATLLRRKFRDVVFRNAPMEPWFRRMLGCDRDQLRQHLEALFDPWMTWSNYGAGKNPR